jgi:hypothetical protein
MPDPIPNPKLDDYRAMAKRRAQIEHRTMDIWEHQGTAHRVATGMLQVRPTDMDPPPDGWILLETVEDPSVQE